MEHHKRRWSVIYEGDVGSAWEWCQIKLHTSCDVPATLNQLKTTVVDGARSIFAPAVVVIYKFFNFFSNFFLIFLLIFAKNTQLFRLWVRNKNPVVSSLSKRGHTWYHGKWCAEVIISHVSFSSELSFPTSCTHKNPIIYRYKYFYY